MSANVTYWRGWFTWAQGYLLGLAKKGDLLGAAAFLAETSATVQLAFEPFDSLALCFKGNFFQIATRLGGWAASHHDPLGAFRHAAETMKGKWDNHANPGVLTDG